MFSGTVKASDQKLENQIDILALNETFLKPKFKFHLPGYDIYKNDRLVGTMGGVAILVKKGIIVNQEWKNEHFNVITDNEVTQELTTAVLRQRKLIQLARCKFYAFQLASFARPWEGLHTGPLWSVPKRR